VTATAAPPVRPHRFVLYPLLFAAYPVLFLWSQNVGEANPADVLPLVGVAVAVAAAATAVLTLVFRDARRAALVVTPVIIGLLMYGHVANLVHAFHVRPLIQQAGWLALAGLGFVAASRLDDARLRQVSTVLDRVGALLIVITLVIIVPFEVSAAGRATAAPPPATAATASTRSLRDVYYLVLDRYGSDRALKLRFGIDNDITPWLVEHGFRVLSDSHANYVKTSMSLASTLSMSHLTDLAARMGKDSSNHRPIFSLLKNSAVVRQFRALGYRYLHIGTHFEPTQTDEAADRNLYGGGPSDFAATLLDTSAIPTLSKRLGLSRGDWLYERAYHDGVYGWKALASVRDEPGPKLVIAHMLLPHPPYAFARDGHFLTPAERRNLGERAQFAGHLGWTNEQLEAWITSIRALPPDRQPIIIVQADEGPYPPAYEADQENYDWSTASLADLQTKYGILNAWYVPGGIDVGLYDTMTSVNTFPSLFSGYFGVDVPKLEDRSYTTRGKFRPYDLTDITDRLRSPVP
jgi:hypothetical protein